jgi:hypothetical protein
LCLRIKPRRRPRSGTQAGSCGYGGDVAQRKLIVATRSGHHVQLDEPELVVKAIRDALAAARK